MRICYLGFWPQMALLKAAIDDFDVEWSYSANPYTKIVVSKNSSNAHYMWLTFKNKKNRKIIISDIGLLTNDGTKTVMRKSEDRYILEPFSKIEVQVSVRGLNLDVAGHAQWYCAYD